MASLVTTVADLGELRLLEEVLLPRVASMPTGRGDDCARLEQFHRRLLWSIDPCPTPVAQLLDVCTPKVLGWYTALINLSDIAACGGKPVGMLVSMEMPDDTQVTFIDAFNDGLLAALAPHDAALLGGNVKSAPKFSATGTIVGTEGTRTVSRLIEHNDCSAYLIGNCGQFWASVVGHQQGWSTATVGEVDFLRNALLFPKPQLAAGAMLSELPFQVACMDCSDGPANALFQLAKSNGLDLIVPDTPNWAIPEAARKLLAFHKISLENACYNFGDWQLACLVPNQRRLEFEHSMRDFSLTWMGYTKAGLGNVKTDGLRQLSQHSLNQNFQKGYNSITSAGELVDRFLRKPIF